MPMIARCRCGAVEIEASGAPIVSTVCYCEDCQTGSRQIEELPGAALPKGYKIKEGSVTNRVAATCCHSARLLNFDKGPFWVPVYRARLLGEPPPLEMRICTRSRPAGGAIPNDAPSYAGYPPRLMMRFVAAGLGMLLRR